MRIAIWHNLPSGGGKRALYYHVKALLEAGHYLEAWTTDMSSETYLPLQELITEHRKPLKEKIQATLKIKNTLKQEQRKIALMEEQCQTVAKEIEIGGFDLLFASSCSFSYMPYIGKFTKIPAIVYLGEPFRAHHEAMPENPWQAPYDKLRIKKIKRLYKDYFINYAKRLRVKKEIEAAKSYKKILVNSLFSRENVIRAYGIDATVCYLGVDTTLFKNDVKDKEPYVVGLGSFASIKGVHHAIESIALISKEKRPTLKWICNGIDTIYYNEMQNLCLQKDVKLEVFQNIPDIKLIETVAKAAVMIYTSKLEPFGLAPLEANACGTYVVAIAEGGVRESITHGVNGALINGYQLDKFQEAIFMFIDDLELARIKGIGAQTFVQKNWNLESMAKNILFEFESLLNG